MPRWNLTETRRLQKNKNCQTKSKGLRIQMKALDEYVLMVMFELVLKRVHFLVIFICFIWSDKQQYR